MQSWQRVEEALVQVQEDGIAGFSAWKVRLRLRQVLWWWRLTVAPAEVQVEAQEGKIPRIHSSVCLIKTRLAFSKLKIFSNDKWYPFELTHKYQTTKYACFFFYFIFFINIHALFSEILMGMLKHVLSHKKVIQSSSSLINLSNYCHQAPQRTRA